VPKEQVVTIELRVDESDHDDPLIVSLSFTEDEIAKEEEKEKPKSGFQVTGDGKGVKISFLNWNNPFGASLQKPISFAESIEGEDVYILASARVSGKIYELTLQFLKGDAI
jgi:hypothetical protein